MYYRAIGQTARHKHTPVTCSGYELYTRTKLTKTHQPARRHIPICNI